MYCRYCNAELMAGAVFCAQCGKPVTPELSTDEDKSDDQPAPFTLAAPTNGPSVTPSDAGQPPSADPQQPAPQATSYPSEQFGSGPQIPVYLSEQPDQNAGQYPPQQGDASPLYYQGMLPASQFNVQPPFAAPKRRGLSPMFVVLLIVLALLVGGGGVVAYFVIITHRTSITTNDPQQLYTQATSGAPTLNDPLNASNPNGWHSTSSNTTCTFSESALHADATAAGSGQTTESLCVAPAANFNDFAYEVQTTINRGNITGLAFRSDTSARVVYLFGISRTGNYILVGVTVDSAGNPSVKILAQGTSQAIQTGAGFSNLLTVIARGSRFDLYVNKEYLTNATDTTARGGVIGVFGENTFGGPLEVFFSSIKVWQL